MFIFTNISTFGENFRYEIVTFLVNIFFHLYLIFCGILVIVGVKTFNDKHVTFPLLILNVKIFKFLHNIKKRKKT